MLNHPIFEYLKSVSEELNVASYAVGGFVRDSFLKRPNKDLDILVLGKGIDFAKALAKKLPEKTKVSYFQNFGTAMLRFEDLEIEFVGARKESYNRNSRKPIVEDGTLEDDLDRRDFTINALAINIFPDFGNLIDRFGGKNDLLEKRLITPLEPNITFSDDPLRMMRAIRFASQLNFEIAPPTLKAIEENRLRIKIVSQERIADELNKIVLSAKPSIGFKLLFNTKLLPLIFPEMQNLQGIKVKDGKGHKDNFYHTLKVLDNVAAVSEDLWLRWAAILHDIAKPPTQRFDKKVGWTFHGHDDLGAKMTPQIFRKLKLPLNENMKFVQKLVRLHLRPIALTKTEVTDSAVRRLLFEAGDDIDALMKLCRADITSKNEFKVKRYHKNFELLEQKIQEVEAKDKMRNWQPPITGETIMKTFNISPSRMVGKIKLAIREAILDGIIPNEYDAAFQLMLEEGKKMGLKKDGN